MFPNIMDYITHLNGFWPLLEAPPEGGGEALMLDRMTLVVLLYPLLKSV